MKIVARRLQEQPATGALRRMRTTSSRSRAFTDGSRCDLVADDEHRHGGTRQYVLADAAQQ
jgi:hypothetical protein